MKWWAQSRLRTKIFLAFSAVILVSLLLTLWLTQLVVSRQVQETLRAEMLTTGQVFQGIVVERAARLLANTTLLASDFALKRAMATIEDPSTLISVALNYQQRIAVDLLWMIDATGVLLADVIGTHKKGETVAQIPPLTEALASGEASAAIAERDGALFQLVAVPVFAPDVIGFLVLGESIDDPLARQLMQDTGSQISFLTRDRLLASSWPHTERDHFLSSNHGIAKALQYPPGETFLLSHAGERFLSIVVPIDSRLSTPLYALVQRSYDTALAPLRALQQRIIVIGGGTLLMGLFLGVGLAGGIVSPIQTLVAGMQEILKGNFGYRLRIRREDEIGFLARSFNEMAGGLEEREKLNDIFGRFVSRDVAKAALSGLIPLAGERREVSILFQDIRSFTTMSEQRDPQELLQVLNRFFSEVVAAVEAEGGVVKQFTGDGVMALFGAPVAHPDDPARAVRAALGMIRRLVGLNAHFSSQNLPMLRIGVGIHTGEVVVGLIGPDERIEYGVVGDVVNLASRLQELTKEYDVPLILSEATYQQVSAVFPCRSLGTIVVRGRQQETALYTVEGKQV